MFMVVAVEDKKEPLRQRLGRLLRGDALEWEDRSCGGNRYRYIVWHGPVERLPWNRLALLCPRPRSPVLLPRRYWHRRAAHCGITGRKTLRQG